MHAINFVYPPRCVACGEPLAIHSAGSVCARCLGRAEPLAVPACSICAAALSPHAAQRPQARCHRCEQEPASFRRVVAITSYRSAAEDERESLPALIRRHKYGFDQTLARALAEFLPATLPLECDDYDMVVPVPLHWRRLWRRGFNQSALLAAEVAKRLGLTLELAGLRRIRHTKAQTARDQAERERNVRRAFAVRYPRRFQNRRILLVDDVVTTGATADECARTLLEAGARYIDVFALARVP